MNAGYELDKLVAEIIMGWVYFDGDYYEPFYNGDRYLGKRLVCDITEFQPSRHIKDAWKIINKLKKDSIYTNIRMDESGCEVSMYKSHGDSFEWVSIGQEARTETLAICLAGLEAKGF